MKTSILKFLDMVVDYLAKGVVPNIYCKNVSLVKELFILLNMNPTYSNYLIETFSKRNSKFKLRLLTNQEVKTLKTRIKGEAEYFCLYDPKYNECIYFYIGPYEYPIHIIH